MRRAHYHRYWIGKRNSDERQLVTRWVHECLCGLTEDEARFLSCVLSGKDIGWIRSKGLMESLLVDSINDKLYAEFGDTVLEDAEGPEVIPDYAEELKGKFQL